MDQCQELLAADPEMTLAPEEPGEPIDLMKDYMLAIQKWQENNARK